MYKRQEQCRDNERVCRDGFERLFQRDLTSARKYRQRNDGQNVVHRNIKTEFIHSHLKYGRTVSEELSLDLQTFKSLNMLEPPVLDCAFDFKVISVNTLPQAKTFLLYTSLLPVMYF